jgi:hypothetical protein
MVVAAAAEAAAGLEVAATAGSLDAEVAAGSAVAAGSELAGAAAAASASVHSGSVVGGPAAVPGERVACANDRPCTTLGSPLVSRGFVGLRVREISGDGMGHPPMKPWQPFIVARGQSLRYWMRAAEEPDR